MRFSELPHSAAAVLTLLHSAGILLRTEIVKALDDAEGTPTSTTDTGIKRLVADGLIERREDKSYWLTDLGKQLMQDYEEKKKAQGIAPVLPKLIALNMGQELAAAGATAVLAEQAAADGEAFEERFIAARAMQEVELDAAIDAAIHRLQMPVIGGTAARVYRRLVAALDVTIQDALKPITKIVEAQP